MKDTQRMTMEDVLAVPAGVSIFDMHDDIPRGLSGYSFGGLMAIYAAGAALSRPGAQAVKALALVSPMSPGVSGWRPFCFGGTWFLRRLTTWPGPCC